MSIQSQKIKMLKTYLANPSQKLKEKYIETFGLVDLIEFQADLQIYLFE